MRLTARPALKASALAVIALFLFFTVFDSLGYARAGGGRSSGTRSSGTTYRSSTPSQTSPSQQYGTNQGTTQQQSTAPSAGRSLLYGLGGGLAGGMLGNMLFGSRGYGSQGSGGGGFGFGDFILILLILAIIYFVVKRYRAKKALQAGGIDSGTYGSYASGAQPAYDASGYNAQPQGNPVSAGIRHIADMDPSFNEKAFTESAEDMFFKIQAAWTKRDLSAVRQLLTPAMLNTFQNDISSAVANKQFNRLENIAVRQVEIVDAVQDQGEEFLTVRFLASLLDYNVDDTTGNVVSGSAVDPVKFLEYWTFSRKVGERNWTLTAITQEQDYR